MLSGFSMNGYGIPAGCAEIRNELFILFHKILSRVFKDKRQRPHCDGDQQLQR
jgi:hypothetical protein